MPAKSKGVRRPLQCPARAVRAGDDAPEQVPASLPTAVAGQKVEALTPFITFPLFLSLLHHERRFMPPGQLQSCTRVPVARCHLGPRRGDSLLPGSWQCCVAPAACTAGLYLGRCPDAAAHPNCYQGSTQGKATPGHLQAGRGQRRPSFPLGGRSELFRLGRLKFHR